MCNSVSFPHLFPLFTILTLVVNKLLCAVKKKMIWLSGQHVPVPSLLGSWWTGGFLMHLWVNKRGGSQKGLGQGCVDRLCHAKVKTPLTVVHGICIKFLALAYHTDSHYSEGYGPLGPLLDNVAVFALTNPQNIEYHFSHCWLHFEHYFDRWLWMCLFRI